VAKSKSGARRATPVEATKHVAARRKNIPTAELEAFAREAEKSPETMLYPREPSLDPQLVWKGKDQQDRQDLAVPVVPIYIQEKIAPRAIIENLRAEKRAASEPQLDLFGDFNGLEFEQLIEFYQHSQHWSNRMILGDSLQVMASLAEKEGLKGQVQMMYVDPPYGIKFGSNWQVSTRKRDIVDGRAQDMSREPEQVRAFRDTWHMGIHSYLAFLRDRLVTARELLTETGSIFVQIGEENLHLVRCLLDEVMGRENFVSVITFSKTAGATTELLPGVADYIVWYARDSSRAKYRRLFTEKIAGGPGAGKYDQVELPDGTRRSLGVEERTDSLLPGSRVFRLDNLTSQSVGREKGEGAASWFPVRLEQREFTPTMRSRWKTNEAGMAKLLTANRVAITGNTLSYVRFIEDFPAFPITNVWLDIGGIQSRADPKVYVVQTATTAIERCLLMTTDPGDLVLDPTSGSGTTAHVAEQWGPSVDRYRHESSRSCDCPDKAHGRAIPVLHPARFVTGHRQRGASHEYGAPITTAAHGWRYSAGVRLRARAPCDFEVNRDQPEPTRRHDAGGGRQINRPSCRGGDAFRPSLYGQQNRESHGALHGRRSFATPLVARGTGCTT
jgi:adenine-specific DNA-methyltransferase